MQQLIKRFLDEGLTRRNHYWKGFRLPKMQARGYQFPVRRL
jgi:hypothetical protein